MHRLQIKHITTYQYAQSVILLPHKLLLRPRENHDIHIESAELAISPTPQLQWQRDVYDNAVARATFSGSCTQLTVSSLIRLQHFDSQPLDFLVADYAVYYPFQYDAAERIELEPYLGSLFEQDRPLLGTWLLPFWYAGQRVETYMLLDWINKAIATGFVYQQREEPGVQTPATTLARHMGSCRDFATLFIEACHYLGLAARFVSGYLFALAQDAADQGATHAWAEVYLPGAGWKGFDSTSGQVVGNDHIPVAVSRHPESVPPISGAFIAAPPQTPIMSVAVNVSRNPNVFADKQPLSLI